MISNTNMGSNSSSSSGSQLLLPLYYVKKTTRKSINEKTLIVFLCVSTLITLVFILNNLPSNVNLSDDNIKEIFLPKLNKSMQFLHGEHAKDQGHTHEFKKIDIQPIEEPVLAPSVLDKREKIKSMTLFAWNAYKKYAWGKNELKPISKTGHTPGIFGRADDLGATIVDGLDTLYMMGFQKEFQEGVEWIKNSFDIKVNTEMSFFEVNIRFIGGFLALYTLTKDKLFVDKAVEVADAFLPVFESPTGITYSLFNPITKTKKNYGWAPNSCSILSEFGSLSLEFQYLSDITGNKIYEQKIEKIYDTLDKMTKKDGLYYNYVNPLNGSWCSTHTSVGGLGDSFYEYLLKYWLYKNKSDDKMLDTYLNAMQAVRNKLVNKSPGGHTYVDEYAGSYLAQKMGHLTCFVGGLFALTAMKVDKLSAQERETYTNLAIEVTDTCHESYVKMPTHIGPEAFSFKNGQEAEPVDYYYILRPEVIESYFYLWRLTKDQKYRDWAWDAAEAIEKHCKTDAGYSGLKDVRSLNSEKDDVQQSFFFAETLKYLYLIFSDDDAMPFDKYVLNTEAHPFLIKN